MMYWLVIILGVLIISLGISNPVYQLVISRFLHTPLLIQIILRFFLLFMGIIIIFLGLYLESNF